MATTALASRIRSVEQAIEQGTPAPARPMVTSAVLAAGDALALLVAGWLGYLSWSRVNSTIGPEFFFQLAPALAVSLVVYAGAGLYPAAGLSPVEELRRIILGTTAVCLISTTALFLSKESALYSRGVFVSSWFIASMLVPVGRSLMRRYLSKRAWWGVPVVVIGSGPIARRLAESLAEKPSYGLKPVAFSEGWLEARSAQEPVTGVLELFSEQARRQHWRIKTAILAPNGLSPDKLRQLLERLETSFERLIIVPDVIGLPSLWVSPKDLSGVLGLEVRQNLLVPANRWIKRAMDLVLASLAAVISLPLVAIAAIWIKCASSGPVFFVQQREGLRGKPIRVRKLRTMHPDADALLLRHLAADPEARRQWERHFKLRRDPRVIPVIGTLLRRTSLDEVPQLWSVLKGEMSLVGPRPFPFYHLDRFDSSFRTLRRRVLPGLTGLWQVSARSDGDLEVQESLDTYYIRNWSLWLDLYILARTVCAVLSGRGAY